MRRLLSVHTNACCTPPLHCSTGDSSVMARIPIASSLNSGLTSSILSPDPDSIVSQFRAYFFDTQLFFDPFVGGNFAQYFFRAHENAGNPTTPESAHQVVEEAQLFIEACHSCYARLSAAQPAKV